MGVTDPGHRIEYWPLYRLAGALDERNAKRHDIPRLEASLTRYGFTLPVLVDDRTNLVLAGHGRVAALMQLHEDQDPPPRRIRVDSSDGMWLVPVICGVDMADDDEALAYLADDNELTIAGGWDRDALAVSLQHLATESRLPVAMDQGYLDQLLADIGTRGEVAPYNRAPTSDDYYTPAWVFEKLGLTFDLDVASPPTPPEWIPARRRFTEADDGLSQPWEGIVWMNPPYSSVVPWVDRFVDHANGVALLPFFKSRFLSLMWESTAVIVVPPSGLIEFVGGHIFQPVFFAGMGPEAEAAVRNIGSARHLTLA